MRPYIYQNGKLLLSYSYLKSEGIKQKTIEQTVLRKRVVPFKLSGASYLHYDNLPQSWLEYLPAKNDLIAKTTVTEIESQVEHYFKQISALQARGFIKFKDHYKTNYQLNTERSIKAAQLHAVWEYLLDINQATGKLEVLYEAFNRLYPGKYSNKHSFANAIKKAKEESIDCLCIDKRIFTAPNNVKRISADCEFWTSALVSLGKKGSNRWIWEKLTEICTAAGKNAPSKSWVDKYRKQILKKNIEIFAARNGNQALTQKMPYVSTHHALKVNQQWQLDAWTLPFWSEGFTRYVVVIVKDAFSKKIVGSACGKSENTILIMDALKKAIINTGCLPFEILSDHHSFNQTKEAEHLRDQLKQFGCTWTHTFNPQHKSIIERHNRHLDDLCREYPGYLGAGIKAKSIDARPKQELIDKAAKPSNWKSETEIKAICLVVVEKFNHKVYKGNLSANDLYEQADKTHCLQIDLFERIRLLTAKTERKITRGQITINRGLNKYEYQLPAELFSAYNDEIVCIRYEDLNECIYLYDRNTDAPITELKPKQKIHGAIANQNETDKQLFNKHKGRLEGIIAKARKSNEEVLKNALKANPEAIELLNTAIMQKDVKQEIERDLRLKRLAEDEGIDLQTLVIPESKTELELESLSAKSKLINKSPFSSKAKKGLSTININDFND